MIDYLREAAFLLEGVGAADVLRLTKAGANENRRRWGCGRSMGALKRAHSPLRRRNDCSLESVNSEGNQSDVRQAVDSPLVSLNDKAIRLRDHRQVAGFIGKRFT